MLCAVWELRVISDVPIKSFDVKRVKLKKFDPCRPICSRLHEIKTSIFKNWTPL
jgi:hypothetical protein